MTRHQTNRIETNRSERTGRESRSVPSGTRWTILALCLLVSMAVGVAAQESADGTFKDQPASGRLFGTEWSFVDGAAQKTPNGELLMRLSAQEERYADPAKSGTLGSYFGDHLSITAPPEAGVYPLDASGVEVRMDIEGGPNPSVIKAVAKSGRLEIRSIDAEKGIVEGSIVINRSEETRINGHFSVPYADLAAAAAQLEIADQTAQGAHGGSDWKFRSGTAVISRGFVQVKLSSRDLEGTNPFEASKPFAESRVIEFSVPPNTGTYEAQQVTFLVAGVGFAPGMTDTTRIRITSIDSDPGKLSGRIVAKADGENHVNGSFTVPFKE